jgi:plasmid maintenance system antidote protein VapI
MTLREYLENEKISPSAWALKVGIPQPVITRFLGGKRNISLKTAFKIITASGGAVTFEDLVNQAISSAPFVD